MSGRKSTEVSALLKRGELARQASEGNYRNAINNGAKVVKENEKIARAILEEIIGKNMAFSEECRKEFPKEVAAMEEQFMLLKKKKVDNYGEKVANIQKDFQSVENKICEANRESEEIRRIIQTKFHYCTPEYNRADQILQSYKEYAIKKDALVSKMNGVVDQSSQKKTEMDTAKNNLKKLQKKQQELEEKTRKICELREKANEAKKFLQNQFDKIDEEIAVQFMAQQYDGIQSIVHNLTKLTEQQILDEFDADTEKIGLFTAELDHKYAVFLEEKAKTETALKNCEQMLDDNVFYDAVDYYNEGPNAKQYQLLEYIQKYAQNTSYVSEINILLEEARNLLQNKVFQEAQDKIKEACVKIEKAVSYGVLIQEKMIETTYTAADIRDVMAEFHYRVSLEMISDSPKDGWKIIAESGDERIAFDKIYVSESDDVQIDIDHQITQGGSCGVAWKKIVSKLEEKGVNIKKITMENGTVVTDKTNKMKSSSKKSTEQTKARK